MKKLSLLIVCYLCCNFLLAQNKASDISPLHPRDSVFYSASVSGSKIGLAVTIDKATKWIEYHNTIANQPLNNYVFLEGSKQIGLYASVPADSVIYYRYSILENNDHWLATDVALPRTVPAERFYGRAQIDLGRFNIDNKKLTIEYYKVTERNKVATTIVYNRPIVPATLFLTTFVITTRKGQEAVEMTNQTNGFKFHIRDSLTKKSILLAIKPSDLTFIYHVYIRNLSTGKRVHIGNTWNYGYIGGRPHLLIDAAYFSSPGSYEISIEPLLSSSGFNRRAFPTKTTRISFTVLPSESVYSRKDVLAQITAVFVLAGLAAALIIYLQKKNNARKLQAAKQQKNYVQMQLSTIRSQLNPHFIFNALSGIQNLMNRNETEQANRYLAKFARMTRSILNNKDIVSLTEESKLLDDYLQMEQLRFGFSYTISIDAKLNASNVEIPAMLLQPLVENAVKHGAADLAHTGKIELEFRKQEQALIILIQDNGKGFDVNQESPGLGLALTRNRIALLNTVYKDLPITLMIHSEPSKTRVTVTLDQWL
ncbi:MAG: hypothetical protein EOP45_06405 [Sphingobacteriaceae bacterium]|nr:MAG: hypothetical protein EOP45_06405 [Sphingobacteriaceae bacterium]